MRVLAVSELTVRLIYREKQGRVERVRRCGCHSNILGVRCSVVCQPAAVDTAAHPCSIALVDIVYEKYLRSKEL
jgi:hypothetical protein